MSAPEDFPGTERYQVIRRLGAGGMGIVYEAFDRERGLKVALKTLRHLEAAAIYRLKREFRALADVTHPGLVNLYELVSAGDQWFIVMELVEGVDFLSWVRPGGAAASGEDTLPTALDRPGTPAPFDGAPPTSPAALDLERLRSSLRKLSEGMTALHDAGRLHRDIKPSNVLVTREGRVVLLDFGLVTELEGDSGHASTDSAIVGTASYMAPEQASGAQVTPAVDWYGAGAMLYQALTGRVPFAGSPIQVLMDKQRLEPPPPIELSPGVPPDLNALCVELLRRDPGLRPSGAEVLRRVGGEAAAAPPRPPERASAASTFIGRATQLTSLREAFGATREGKASIVFVHGRSGMGKTALVKRF
ncbi:MAG: serine/threonine-protein kinase, partial [Myxococcaceae bacterium]